MTEERLGWWCVWFRDADAENLAGVCQWTVAARTHDDAVKEALETCVTELGGAPGQYSLIRAERTQ